MTNRALHVLALSMSLAIGAFGCAATPAVAPLSADEGAPAERAFQAMSERCQNGERNESTHNHCAAAINLATRVLHDARRAEDLYRVRCAKFGASEIGNPVCPSILDRAPVEAHAAR